MDAENKTLTPNALAFIGLCKEYCVAVANASQSERDEFIDTMLRILPRIYIMANDLVAAKYEDSADAYLGDYLQEEAYVDASSAIAELLGEYDTYLDVFEEDMKYSDTPIAASISEGLCDLLQELYNFLESVRDATDWTVRGAIAAVCDDFATGWSQTLCNVLRAINHLKYS